MEEVETGTRWSSDALWKKTCFFPSFLPAAVWGGGGMVVMMIVWEGDGEKWKNHKSSQAVVDDVL